MYYARNCVIAKSTLYRNKWKSYLVILGERKTSKPYKNKRKEILRKEIERKVLKNIKVVQRSKRESVQESKIREAESEK